MDLRRLAGDYADARFYLSRRRVRAERRSLKRAANKLRRAEARKAERA